MWRVQGGLSLPAVSRERRVMHPASPHPLCQYAESPRRILLRSLSVTDSLSGSPAPLILSALACTLHSVDLLRGATVDRLGPESVQP